jgi:hypothetical protein
MFFIESPKGNALILKENKIRMLLNTEQKLCMWHNNLYLQKELS